MVAALEGGYVEMWRRVFFTAYDKCWLFRA